MPNTIFFDGAENTLRVSGSGFVRKPIAATFSGPWNVIRVGIRTKIIDAGQTFGGESPRFLLGLCSGSSAIPPAEVVTHYVGTRTGSSTWSRSTGPVRYTSAQYASKKAGDNTSWIVNSFAASPFYNSTLWDAMYLDIAKGSPNFTLTLRGRTTSAATYDVTKSDFLNQLVAATPTISQHGVVGSAKTIAVDEGTDGTLDHFVVAWDQIFPSVLIADIGMVKVS